MPVHTPVSWQKKETSKQQDVEETFHAGALTSTEPVHKTGGGNVWFISNRDYVLEALLSDIKSHPDVSSTLRILMWRNLKSPAPAPLCFSLQPSRASPAFLPLWTLTCQRLEKLETAMCAYCRAALKDLVFTDRMPTKTVYLTCIPSKPCDSFSAFNVMTTLIKGLLSYQVLMKHLVDI